MKIDEMDANVFYSLVCERLKNGPWNLLDEESHAEAMHLLELKSRLEAYLNGPSTPALVA